MPISGDEIAWTRASPALDASENVRVAVAICEYAGFRFCAWVEYAETVQLPVRREIETVLNDERKSAGPTSKDR